MSRRNIDSVLETVVSDVVYLPSPEQRKIKSAFWSRFNDNPLCDPQDITMSIVERLVADSRLPRWWSQPGFKEWFRNREEFRERAEYLAHLVLDSLEAVLINPEEKGASKVAAGKLIMELARKMPTRGQPEGGDYLDAKIASMDKKQLQEYIDRQLKLIKPATPADTTKPDVSPDI